jgi:hypothetical protein
MDTVMVLTPLASGVKLRHKWASELLVEKVRLVTQGDEDIYSRLLDAYGRGGCLFGNCI